MIELVEQRWNKKVAARFGEVLEDLQGTEFSQRLCSVGELRQIYASVGMGLLIVYHGSGRPREPKAGQFEIFVEARKGGQGVAG
jgi:hypothetical protein